MKVAITCPVFVSNDEHLKWLNNTTTSIVSLDHDLVFIPVENYVAPQYRPLVYTFLHNPLEITIFNAIENQSVSKAWNLGINVAKLHNCDYVLVTNTDIVLKSNAIDRLVAFAQQRNDAVMWTMSEYVDYDAIELAREDENFSEHPNFSCFMVETRFLDYVGLFDENFIPAYCEDADMHVRLAQAHLKAYTYGGAKFYHKRSNTITTDSLLWSNNSKTYPKNEKYFMNKWGAPIKIAEGNVDKMRELFYKHPYNEEDKPLSYWRPL